MPPPAVSLSVCTSLPLYVCMFYEPLFFVQDRSERDREREPQPKFGLKVLVPGITAGCLIGKASWFRHSFFLLLGLDYNVCFTNFVWTSPRPAPPPAPRPPRSHHPPLSLPCILCSAADVSQVSDEGEGLHPSRQSVLAPRSPPRRYHARERIHVFPTCPPRFFTFTIPIPS